MITLHESIKRKIADGWSDDRLRQEYHWISESCLGAVIRSAKAELDAGHAVTRIGRNEEESE